MDSKIEFAAAMPIPPVFDVKNHVQQLRRYLDPSDPDFQPVQQHKNIAAAIELYENKIIDGLQRVYIMDGKLVSRKEAFKGPGWTWGEGIAHQRLQKFSYSHRPFGPNGHELRMLLRLAPERGGDGTVHGIIVLNDTGSEILSLFSFDLLFLGDLHAYTGWIGFALISNASGTNEKLSVILVEVQLVTNENVPWTSWIEEEAVVRPAVPGMVRLSGMGIREILYFGTSPGNTVLATSMTKGGLASLL